LKIGFWRVLTIGSFLIVQFTISRQLFMMFCNVPYCGYASAKKPCHDADIKN
jgi:hypothetical protein